MSEQRGIHVSACVFQILKDISRKWSRLHHPFNCSISQSCLLVLLISTNRAYFHKSNCNLKRCAKPIRDTPQLCLWFVSQLESEIETTRPLTSLMSPLYPLILSWHYNSISFDFTFHIYFPFFIIWNFLYLRFRKHEVLHSSRISSVPATTRRRSVQ